MIDDDGEHVKRALAGEKTSFGPLIDRHKSAAVRLARRMLGDAIDAEDVMQEALLHAFLGLASLRTPNSFGPWLLGIVVNLCRMRIRARRDWHPADEWHGGRVPEDFTLADLQPSPEAIYEARELHDIVLARSYLGYPGGEPGQEISEKYSAIWYGQPTKDISPDMIQADGQHFTKEGYAVLAKNISLLIKDILR